MKRLLRSLGLTMALLIATTGTVLAQDTTPTTITGTVQSVALETDGTGAVTAVVVTYTDSAGATQTVSLTLADATAQGLVSTDAAGVTTVNDGVEGLPVTIPVTTTTEEEQHPVGSALGDFFKETLGVDYQTIMDYHDEGAGFGVMAQALWMSTKSDGAISFQTIMDAKLSGDYGAITLEDGSSPTNWGQFKKAILQGEKNNSLGDIMSGKQDPGTGQTLSDPTLSDPTLSDQNQAGTNDHGNSGNSHGNGNENKNKDKGHGHVHSHGHGHGHP